MQSTSSVSNNNGSTKASRTESRSDSDRKEHKVNKQQIREFRFLMQQQGGKQQSGVGEFAGKDPGLLQQKDTRHGDGLLRFDLDWMPQTQVNQAQTATLNHSTAPATAAPMAGPALAELIEKHVRQLLVSETATENGNGDVLLRMNDDSLPGTDLWLSRTERGWKVRADVQSRESYDAIMAGGEYLTARFAERNLGDLEIEPNLLDR